MRLRLRNACGLDDAHVVESHVLRRVSPWYFPVAPGSPMAARLLTAARVGAGFVDHDIIKWLLVRRRLAPSLAARLIQQWFRGARFIRLALRLFAPFVGSTVTIAMPPWCVHRVHIAWIQTDPNEWSQWVLSFQAQSFWHQMHSADPEPPPISTTVRRRAMNRFDGCRRWPWPHEIHQQSNFMASPDDCNSFHSLVSPLWAASFWRNADASLKDGVRLAHQKSHKVVIPSGLLRWSYGLAPDVSPPPKSDWRRGAL